LDKQRFVFWMKKLFLSPLLWCVLGFLSADAQVVLSGQLKKWHKVTLTLESGITLSETVAPNPFTDYRLNVTFTNGAKTYTVPGFFAGDGNAANTRATSGTKWRVHFSPDATGTWNYTVSFRAGSFVSVSDNVNAGTAVAPLNGLTGSFSITPTDKSGFDFRGKGRLEYVGEHHLRFAETGEYYLKGGCNSPENFLAYWEFDGTYDNGGIATTLTNGLHRYSTHVSDWHTGDPVWQNGEGKGIIGSLNYLASQEVNAMYFLTNNITGDGDDVWPYVSHNEADFTRFDVSKLDQWETVFAHADSVGIMLHFVMQERENQMLLDNGDVGNTRKLYYREMLARFSHHLAITWNMGEENGWDYQGRGAQTDQQRRDMATYFKTHDPYKSFVVIHTYTDDVDLIYQPLLGYPDYDGMSIQMALTNVHDFTINWIDNSDASGKKWVVCHDETVAGVDPNGTGTNQGNLREQVLWAHYMAGGGGVEWYFGMSEINTENFRNYSGMWGYTRKAMYFFKNYLPFWQMQSNDGITSNTTDYVFELPGRIYAVYSRFANSTNITLPAGSYTVKWFDPTNANWNLLNGSVTSVQGGGSVYLGNPPSSNNDWAILVTSNFSASLNVTHAGCDGQGGAISVITTGGISPFTYSWSNGASASAISNLQPGTYTVTVTDNIGASIIDSIEVVQSGIVSMNLKVILEGPYDALSGLMRDDLRVAGLIPATEPFTALGFTQTGGGGGETIGAGVLNITGNNAIVDWVLVELRSKSNRSIILATHAALLQRDGDIVEEDGQTPLTFSSTPCDDYYVAIRHRNHFGFVTANVQTLTSTLTLDLTSTSAPLYGSNPMKIVSGKRVMWAGNCNADLLIKYIGASNDRDVIYARLGGIIPTSISSGYFREDVNLDGRVKYMGANNDRDLILINVGGSTPTLTRTEQLP